MMDTNGIQIHFNVKKNAMTNAMYGLMAVMIMNVTVSTILSEKPRKHVKFIKIHIAKNVRII
jgi:hypothetical protein